MRLLTRAAGIASRRLERPELLAAVSAEARRNQQEDLGMRTALACSLHGSGVYVDVGANRGQVLRQAVRIAPNGHHVAFEPIPALAAEIARSFPAVDCRRRAVGARAETAEFCYFHQLDGWSGLRRRPQISDSRGRPEFIEVEVSTLDAELDGITPSVIKIDVEGAESAVLEGGRSVLERALPLVIFEHEPEAAALYEAPPGRPWDLLSELGYEIFSATGQGPFTRAAFTAGGGTVNWLATPPARRPG